MSNESRRSPALPADVKFRAEQKLGRRPEGLPHAGCVPPIFNCSNPLIKPLLSDRRAVFLQQPRQFGAAAVQTRFYGALRDRENLGDFAILHFLQIAEDDGFPQLGRKLSERRLQQFAGFAAGDGAVGAAGRPEFFLGAALTPGSCSSIESVIRSFLVRR